ncbi:MAG TPA: Rv2175c family DNA-binding protein [Actinomycetes bacterium]|nr:Rv2175c family DNA-binding protein [Actinomycetes bacterium]
MNSSASLDTPLTDDVEALVADWLTVPELADRLGLDVVQTRQLLKDRRLVAVRRGERRVVSVPADFVVAGEIVNKLPGLLTLLADAGFDENEALRWLFSDDETLPGTPMRALTENRGTEVRRRAQALAF